MRRKKDTQKNSFIGHKLIECNKKVKLKALIDPNIRL